MVHGLCGGFDSCAFGRFPIVFTLWWWLKFIGYPGSASEILHKRLGSALVGAYC